MVNGESVRMGDEVNGQQRDNGWRVSEVAEGDLGEVVKHRNQIHAVIR